MKKLLRALKQWTLLIAIVVGAVGHSFFSQFTWLAPWLLASMLLLTFCNISPRDLRFHPLHLILMSLQIVMSLGLYALTLPWHPAIAQGVCMAALTPTATAAAIITGMLGGSVAFLAAYAFLSNLAIVVLAPLVLPLIATGQIDTPFLETMSNVFMRVGPTMLFPLLTAWLIQYAAPKVNAVLLRWGILAYYLWAPLNSSSSQAKRTTSSKSSLPLPGSPSAPPTSSSASPSVPASTAASRAGRRWRKKTSSCPCG